MGFLAGKKVLITGLLSNRSIAYGIAKACHREGAELAFTYAGDRSCDRVHAFAEEFGSDLVFKMDVSSDEEIQSAVEGIGNAWGALDGVVHSIGFAPREAIAGDFLEGLSREAFEKKDFMKLREVDALEDEIDNERRRLVQTHIQRLNEGKCQPQNSSVFINLVGNLERAADHITYIAHSIEQNQ